MEINITKPVQVNAKYFQINCKVCDEFCGQLLDHDNQVLVDYEGYVPSLIMPDTHGGDYINLWIDIDTGVILNWKQLKAGDVQDFIEESKIED